MFRIVRHGFTMEVCGAFMSIMCKKKAIHVEEHDITGLKLVAQQISSFYILTKKRDLAEVHKALDKVDIVFEEKNHDSPMIFARYAR